MTGTPANGNRASWRAKISPMAARRAILRRLRSSPKPGRRASEAPGRVERSDAPREIAVSDLFEPGAGDHFGQLALARETANALDQIGISLAVAGDDLPEQGHDMKAVEIVEQLQRRPYPGGEFETNEAAAWLQYALRLGERGLDAGHIAQPKRDRIEIEAALGEGQPLGVGAQPLDAVEYTPVERAGASDLEHALVGIADDRAPLGDCALWSEVLQHTQCDITCATGHVNQLLTGLRLQPRNHFGLPQPMDAAAHQIVHQIVPLRDAVEDAAD